MKQQLETIRQFALKAIEEAEDQQGLENLRVKYLGKKGELTAILKQMGKGRPVLFCGRTLDVAESAAPSVLQCVHVRACFRPGHKQRAFPHRAAGPPTVA